MLKPSNNIDKELKKVQDKGITNSKNKIIVIVVAIAVTVFLGTTYALFSSDGVLTAYSSKVNKKVTVTVNSTNGTVNSLSGTVLKDNEIKTSPNFSASHTDKGLYVQKDDNTKSVDGKPTYYFRGNVDNNYVSFAGLLWRIVRINEDGTIRLIIAKKTIVSNYTALTTGAFEGSLAKEAADNWYNTLTADQKSFIVTGKFCNDITNTASNRLSSNPTFVCPSGANYLNLNVGIITADEARYAGSGFGGYSTTYLDTSSWFWTMTTADSSNMYQVLESRVMNYSSPINNRGLDVKQVINLKADVKISSGDGTSSNPFVVDSNSLTSVSNTADYKVTQYFSAIPNSGYEYESLSCTNSQSASYDKATGKLIITPTKDTTCTVKFKKKAVSNTILANNTIITSTPDFSKGEPPASGTNTGSGLYKTADDYGTSYYFRGAIDNNYVSFAGMIWRIVRINGNNTVRLVLDGTTSRLYYNGTLKTNMGSKAWFNTTYNANKYVGYMYDSSSNDANATVTKSSASSTIKTAVDTFYKNYLINYSSYLSDTLFCGDRSISSGTGKGAATTYYSAYKRRETNSPTLLCSQKNDRYTTDDTTVGNGALTYPIGLLSYDEYVYAGAYYRTKNVNYYLHNDLINTETTSFTMTPAYFNTSINFSANYYSEPSWAVSEGNIVHGARAVRPVINLNSNVYITGGDGTSSNPYTIT